MGFHGPVLRRCLTVILFLACLSDAGCHGDESRKNFKKQIDKAMKQSFQKKGNFSPPAEGMQKTVPPLGTYGTGVLSLSSGFFSIPRIVKNPSSKEPPASSFPASGHFAKKTKDPSSFLTSTVGIQPTQSLPSTGRPLS